MPDVAIVHAADKRAVAARLAEAVASAGFEVGAVEVEDPAGLGDAVAGCEAKARILIWSRPLVSHTLHSGDLPRIRQLHGVIEVSADGITPPSRGDDNRVVLISGWRGQPFHPGWQRIHAELKRLCGARKPAPESPPPASAPAKPAGQRATQAETPRSGSRPQARWMLGGGIAVLLAAGAVGAASWLRSAAPDRSVQELQETRAPQPLREAPGPAPGAAPAPQAAPPAPPGSGSTSSPPPERPAATAAAPEASETRPASRPSSPKPAVRPKPGPSTEGGPAKKYSRKYSKVMRQFCERSGRSTPQCRTFRRSMEAGGRPAD
jgi:hypothetical protein